MKHPCPICGVEQAYSVVDYYCPNPECKPFRFPRTQPDTIQSLKDENAEAMAVIDGLVEALGGSFDYMCGMYMSVNEKKVEKDLARTALATAKAFKEKVRI